jgi:hypothetical protein
MSGSVGRLYRTLTFELRTTAIQSSQTPANGIEAMARTIAATHHERWRIPRSAIGAKVGFAKTKTKGQARTVPAAIAATIHIDGLP